MSRSIVARLIALLLVTATGVYYIAFDAVGLHVVDQPYHIRVVLPSAGGIYQDAYVTYRGVEVGKVSSLDLQPNDVVVVLAINHGTRIPSNVTASVRELTAAAEQYMDLVPSGGDPPGQYLQAGATIPEARTSIPVSVGTLLNTVNSLVDSLNAQDLNTLSAALATGLRDAGGDLHSIIVDGNTLVSALQSAIPGTSELINGGHTVLSTFNATSNDFAQLSTNLDALTAQLKASNSALVSLLQNGSAAGTSLNGFLTQFANPTVGLIDELSQSTDVAFQRQDAIRALFEVLPLFASDVAETVSGGQLHFKVDFNTADPVCSYTPGVPLPSPTVAVGSTANLSATCATVAPNLLQRGADKAPPAHS